MPKSPFIPKNFVVPPQLETPRMRLRCLTINDAVMDFAAVMTSADRLRRVFFADGKWPDGLTLEGNIADLGWHQVEFSNRTSFAYTVVNPDETEVMGCVYFKPGDKQDHDAEIYFWVRDSRLEEGLDEHLSNTVRNWLKESWPFQTPAFPGRDISHENWDKLP